jgi:serine/threonine protein kinase
MCDVWGLVGYFLPFLSSDNIKLKGKKYAIRKELGRGGFSNVYLVEKDGSKKELYALKRVALSAGKKEKEVRTLIFGNSLSESLKGSRNLSNTQRSQTFLTHARLRSGKRFRWCGGVARPFGLLSCM